MKKVRVRFAPSPTGPLHLGGVRTALYNYLFAKRYQGDFILRIEDTDQERLVPGAESYILEALQWCGIEPDEGPSYGGDYGPYHQSERKDIYKPYIEQLLKTGHAYHAFDTPEVLKALRGAAHVEGKAFIYSAHIREQMYNTLNLQPEEIADRLARGLPYVIRFKIPTGQLLELHDEIRGQISVDTHNLDDKILVKSDGMPTYHLTNVIDDHLMQISHVIRGEEWLPSMPLHLLLYRAFGWDRPQFAHLPLILKPEGKGKLSKRDGDRLGFPVFPLRWKDPQSGAIIQGYREAGYFSEAFINMLAFLGWNPGGEQELFSLESLIKKFSLEKVKKSSARFNKEKAQWFNQQYLHQKPLEELTALFRKELRKRQIYAEDYYVQRVVKAVRDRAHFVHEIWDQSAYFFVPPNSYEEKAVKKTWCPDTASYLDQLKDLLQVIEKFTANHLRKNLQGFAKDQQIRFGQLMQPLRLALVGALYGTDIFFIMEMLGRQESTQRLTRLCKVLKKSKN
ncbi:MAG: glutamate--tRNA ligase [Flavobacteriales bacterium AspAUS03]